MLVHLQVNNNLLTYGYLLIYYRDNYNDPNQQIINNFDLGNGYIYTFISMTLRIAVGFGIVVIG